MIWESCAAGIRAAYQLILRLMVQWPDSLHVKVVLIKTLNPGLHFVWRVDD